MISSGCRPVRRGKAAARRLALLRQVFGVCASSPAQVVSLQKIQGRLQDAGALEGSCGRWAVEVKTGPVDVPALRGLLEFTRRFPSYRPLVLCDAAGLRSAGRAGVAAMTWSDFLLAGPPGAAGRPRRT
jgi:predicted RecB family endonuclease